jgi:hypothetical protein
MAERQHYLHGVCKWAKVFEPDNKYNTYSIQVCLDDESQKEFDASKIRVRPQLDENDGREYYRFRRDEQFGPPIVVDDSGKPFTEKIGNGSEVTVRVESYDTKTMGKGHRLMAVRVDKHKEFKVDPEYIAKREAAKLANLPPVDGVQF